MSVVVVATFTPAPEHVDGALAALVDAVGPTHAESGCELFAVHRSKKQIVVVEQWSDGDALAAHAEGPVYAALTARLEGLLAEPISVAFLRPVPAGTDHQGQLRP